VSGDEPAMRAQADQGAADLAALLRPSSTANDCAADKLRAAGKKVLGKTRCHASSLKRAE
jgi:hypothetical protein